MILCKKPGSAEEAIAIIALWKKEWKSEYNIRIMTLALQNIVTQQID